MRRSLLTPVLAAALLAASAADAGAAPPWSEPTLTTAGLELASSGGPTLVGIAGARVLGATVEGGVAGPTRESAAPFGVTQARVGQGDRVVAGGDLPSARRRPITPASPAVASAAGSARAQSLRGRSRSSWLLDLATNDAGDAVAAVRWCHTEGCGRQSLQLFRWRAGARLGRPTRIARGRALGAGVALNARGDVAVVWDRRRGRARRAVYGQILTASGRLRPRRLLGHAPAPPRYRIAVTGTRRVVAAWVAQAVSECDASPGEIAVAQAGAGGRFTRARRLARLRITGCGRYAREPGVAFARGPDGRVLIAWSGNEGARWVVRAGELGASGVTGTAVVSDRATDAVLADLAVGPGGEAVVLLADGVGGEDPTGPTRLLAVTRCTGRRLRRSEVVTDQFVAGGTVAFDPATRSPVVSYGAHRPDFTPATAVVTRSPQP